VRELCARLTKLKNPLRSLWYAQRHLFLDRSQDERRTAIKQWLRSQNDQQQAQRREFKQGTANGRASGNSTGRLITLTDAEISTIMADQRAKNDLGQ
jgi:hypothetical protein